jgi:exodeoxyribonuclease-3
MWKMRLYSWNVNGLRACVKKGFLKYFKEVDADFFCVQEIKLQEGQIDLDLEGYYDYWHYADKKGYSGTAIFTIHKPLEVTLGMHKEEHFGEGRIITLKYDDFYLVNVYTPNSKRGLERLDNRVEWEDDFRNYLNELKEEKPTIICGDLNVAHKEIDLKNPSSNRNNAGFTDEERNKFSELLDSGFIDTFRHFYPDLEDIYSWWSYMRKSRERNSGWRIDYFLVSEDLKNSLNNAEIHTEIMGSDHCPVSLDIF